MKEKEKLKTYLESYGGIISTFEDLEPDKDFELSMAYVERLELEDNKNKLSKNELEELKRYNQIALETYEKVKHLDMPIVDWLKDIVSIINGKVPFRV